MGNVPCKVSRRRMSTIWEIKATNKTMAISIKDGSFILAWDKLDHPIGSNNNNPPCTRGKQSWRRNLNNSCKCLFQITRVHKLHFIIRKLN